MGITVDYDEDTKLYYANVDWRERKPSTSIVEILSFITGRAETDLDPLYGSIDPESLDRLLTTEPSDDGGLEISFTHGEFTITATDTGDVHVQRADVLDGSH